MYRFRLGTDEVNDSWGYFFLNRCVHEDLCVYSHIYNDVNYRKNEIQGISNVHD